MIASKRAFTLIELLVVIAIIAILAAILFPVFAQAKMAAKKTQAISNTKQLLLAGIQYMDENDDGILPRYDACGVAGLPNSPGNLTNIWPNLIQPYVKNEGVFLDPAAGPGEGTGHGVAHYGGIWTDDGGGAAGYAGKFGRGWDAIGKNQTIMGWYFYDASNPTCPASFPRNGVGQMAQPAKTVFFMSSNSGATASGWRGYLADNADYNRAGNQWGLPTIGGQLNLCMRYNGGTILGLFDGHAKFYSTKAILGHGDAASLNAHPCQDSSFYTGNYWFDINASKLKFNIQDPCIKDPDNGG